MNWQRDLIERLAACTPGGYGVRSEAATEPTALAGVALYAAGRRDVALAAGQWLAAHQADSGSVGVTATQPTPCWPTSLAILLWNSIGDERFQNALDRAINWILADRGVPIRRGELVGHDVNLIGWSWAANTHSWIEPTAMAVLALKAVGKSQHPRTREAVRLIVDRLLPNGGCNYGNTTVLGQELLAHVEPTGLALAALAGEDVGDPRIERSLQLLERELSAETTTASLCYGLVGLATHGRQLAERDAWLQAAYERVVMSGASPYKLALIAIAALEPSPLLNPSSTSSKEAAV